MKRIIELSEKEMAVVAGGMGILLGGCVPPKKFPKFLQGNRTKARGNTKPMEMEQIFRLPS